MGAAAATAAPELRGVLQDTDETVRCQAAQALGRIGAADETTLAALVELLSDASAGAHCGGAVLGFLKRPPRRR